MKLLVVLGPTATGKTDLALNLAKKFNGELVACDSRQVYKGLDIGTGKNPSSKFKDQNSKLEKTKGHWEINGIKIWMYDLVSPNSQYTVAEYVKDANKVISNIVTSNKLPIVVGGTGLYLKALLEGLPNLSIPADKKLRKELENLSVGELEKILQSLSPSKWEKLNQSDRQNPRRLLRSIELHLMNPYRRTNQKLNIKNQNYSILKVGLTAPRAKLYKKIDLRVLSWLDQGIIDEVKILNNSGVSLKRMKQLGLEYGVLADYLNGKIKTIDELVKVMQGKIHGYVRRQLTWFKKEKGVNWFDVEDNDFADKVENLISRWYDSAEI